MAHEATALLIDLRRGRRTATDELFPLLYDELRALAHRHLGRERPGHTLSTTALVHEAYERLVDQTRTEWSDRAHFCAVASQAMRRVLVDYARRRNALKRGGAQQPLPLDERRIDVQAQAEHLVALDEALDRLGGFDERAAQVVEMRFFGGMTEEEVAEALRVSARTIRRDWVKARAWLFQALYPDAL